MTRTIALLVAVALAGFVANRFATRKEEDMMNRYDWLALRSAPPYCPIDIASSNFFYHGGGTIYLTPGTIEEKEWGDSSKIDIVGPDQKRLPDKLEVTFHSYWEDRTYQGTFDLPYERIRELFARGYTNLQLPGKQHATYQWIVAGVAPGGAVTVWLSGVGRQTEVLFGYAKPVELNWNATFDYPRTMDRHETIAETLAQLPDNATTRAYREHVPFDLWERWRKRYAWYPVFENVARPAYLFPVTYFNAEKEDIQLPQTAPTEGGHPAPRELHFEYVDLADNELCKSVSTFDENEILAAFERLGASGEPFQLVVRSETPSLTPTRVLLRNATTSVTLEKTQFKLIGTGRYASH